MLCNQLFFDEDVVYTLRPFRCAKIHCCEDICQKKNGFIYAFLQYILRNVVQ